MKLLPKREANLETQRQKKSLIDEGLGLARKVDSLREEKSIEEGKLNRFRKETIEVVQKDIDSIIAKRESLKGEIKTLEKERKALMLPLDKEWEKVKAAYLKYSDQVELLESSKETVARQIGENTMLAHELNREKDRIENLRHQVDDMVEKAVHDTEQMRSEASELRETAREMLESADLREKIVVRKEHALEKALEENAKASKRLAVWEKELTNRERLLADRYATLERTINRSKK